MALTGTMNNPGTVIHGRLGHGGGPGRGGCRRDAHREGPPRSDGARRRGRVGELRPYAGKVTEIAGTAVKRTGRRSRSSPVKIALDRPDERLRPGMTAKARIEVEKAENALTIPIVGPAEAGEGVREGRRRAGQEEGEKGRGGLGNGDGEGAGGAGPAGAEASSPPAESPGGAPEGEQGRGQARRSSSTSSREGGARPRRDRDERRDDVMVLDGLREGDTVVTGPYRALKKLKERRRGPGEHGGGQGGKRPSGRLARVLRRGRIGTMSDLISLADVQKIYDMGPVQCERSTGSRSRSTGGVPRGHGASGSGKSTLMNRSAASTPRPPARTA